MKPTVPIRDALTDPALLGSILTGESWHAWRTILIAAMGEPLTPDEMVTFTALTGRSKPPPRRVEELLAVVGRRGGKSRSMATLAAYIAGLCTHDDVLVRGERGVLLCIAPDQRQAKITLEYAAAAFDATPILAQLVENQTSDTLELTNGITIEVRAASFRRLRGPTYIAVIADETAFWYSDEASANADTEILNAVRPGLATTNGPLILASSPYAKRGETWGLYSRHYGNDGDPLILVVQAESRTLNPSLPASVVERALERDHAAASAEYLARFRDDISAFVPRDVVEACVDRDCRERRPVGGTRYRAFVDPSGGSNDAMTLAISHRDGDRVVIDATREVRPPFSPEGVVQDFAALLRSYRITKVCGDRYGGEWPREQFRKRGIMYDPADKAKSDLYRDLLPLLNSASIVLLNNERLVAQLAGLERRVSRGGRDSIDHAPGGHDDLCNAVAGAASLVMGPQQTVSVTEFHEPGGLFNPFPKKDKLQPRKAMLLGDGWR
jgi:hypothetical protein